MASPKTPQAPYRSTWLGFAEKRPTGRGTVKIHLRFGRILIAFCFLVVAAWMTVASALFFFFKERKGYTDIAWSDVILYPIKKDEIRQKHGNFNIEQALAALEAGEVQQAYNLTRSGLSRAPDNLEGRLLLIRFFQQLDYQTSTRQLFEGGVEYAGDNIQFYQMYGLFLARQRDDTALLELSRAVLERVEDDSRLGKIMALFGSQAASRLGKFKEIPSFYETYDLENNLEGAITAARVLEAYGQVDDAIEYLKNFATRFENEEIGLIRQSLISIYISHERYAEAINAALSYTLKKPLDHRPRVLLVRAYREAGREELAKKEAIGILRQFRKDFAALTALGLYAREAGDVDLARRLYEIALESDLEIPRFGLLFLEAYLSSRDYETTLDLCEELEAEAPIWLKIYESEFAVIQAVAHLGMGNQQLGAIYLQEFLDSQSVRLPVVLAVADTLIEANLQESALLVLESAHERDPEDNLALAKLVGLQLTLGDSRNLTDRVAKLTTLRRSQYTIFKRVKNELSGDRFIFADNREEVAEELDTVLEELNHGRLYIPPFEESNS